MKRTTSNLKHTGKLTALILSAGLAGSASTRPTLDVPPLFVANGIERERQTFVIRSPGMKGLFTPASIMLESQGTQVEMTFVGASQSVVIEPFDPTMTRFSSMLGNNSWLWLRDAKSYAAIRYRDLYPGIDLVYRADSSHLKSEFRISPGSKPSTIRVRYVGDDKPHVDESGCLVVRGPNGEFREAAPVVYQESAGTRTSVAASYVILDERTVGFSIGDYDPALPLIIDPILQFSTFFGGPGYTIISGVAVDLAGNIYFTGWTDATVGPIVAPFQAASRGGNEIFVGKINPSRQVVFVTYLGGSGNDRSTGIAVDAAGSVTITGWTMSKDFPKANAFQPALNGTRDAFVTRLNPSGTQLTFSTFLGGSGDDAANGVALDATGNVYVAGQTYSSTFPTRNGIQSWLGGGSDAFLAKFSPAGSLVYSTYFGGSLDDLANAIAVTPDGTAYIAGATQSIDLGVLSAAQPVSGGGQDAFVAKVDRTGAVLLFATYLGGRGGTPGFPEFATGMALDSAGSAYVTGVTASNNFPTAGGLFGSARGGIDGFVTKLSVAGNQIIYSTYLGGTSVDLANAIAVDSNGNAYIAGATWSADYPSTRSIRSRSNDYDAFVTEVDATGSSILFSTFLGGSAADNATSIALDGAGNIYIGGQSFSYDFPLAAPLGPFKGSSQGILAEILMDSLPSPNSVTPNTGSGFSQQFTVTSSAPTGANDLLRTWVVFSDPASAATCYLVIVAPNSIYLFGDGMSSFLGPLTFGSPGTVENSQCRVNSATSSLQNSGNIQTLKLELYFKPSFAGVKVVNVMVQTAGGQTSPSRVLGAWTTTVDPAASGPAPVSVTPASGSGFSQQFTFVSSDPAGANNLFRTWVVFSNPASSASCYLVIVAPNTIYLFSDGLSNFLGPLAFGQTGAVENSQCRVNGATSSLQNAGTLQTLKLDLYFKPSFAGVKAVSIMNGTAGGQLSQSRVLGAWTATVDPMAVAPMPVSVTPGSGSGLSQQFTVVSTDPAGGNDLFRTWVIFSSTTSPASCYLVIVAPSSVFLFSDNMTAALGPLTLGSTGTVENSQCRLNGASSSLQNSGITQTLRLDLVFKPSFAGAKSVTVYNQTVAGEVSPSRVLGTWTVN